VRSVGPDISGTIDQLDNISLTEVSGFKELATRSRLIQAPSPSRATDLKPCRAELQPQLREGGRRIYPSFGSHFRDLKFFAMAIWEVKLGSAILGLAGRETPVSHPILVTYTTLEGVK
jgi:hypothetical protein